MYRPPTSGPFVGYTAPITPTDRLLVQPIVSVAFTHGSFDEAGRLGPTPEGGLRTSTLALFTELSVADDLAFGAQLSLIHTARAAAWSLGVGELALFSRKVLLTETAGGLPEATLLLQVKVPTGNAQGTPSLLGTDLRGSGSADLTAGLSFTRGIWPVVVHADLLFTHPVPARVDGADTAYGDAFSWSASVEWPFFSERLAAMVELSGRHQLSGKIDGARVIDGHADEVIVGAGLEVLFSRDVQLLVGYQRTLWGRNVSGRRGDPHRRAGVLLGEMTFTLGVSRAVHTERNCLGSRAEDLLPARQ